MRFIDPHIHMSARTTDDYERMAAAGIVAVIEPAFWLGQPRTNVGTLHRLPVEPGRLGALPRLAVRHPPLLHHRAQQQGSQQRGAGRAGDGRAAALPRQGRRGGGRRDRLRRPDRRPRTSTTARSSQLAKELDMLVQVHTPHRDKKRGTIAQHGRRARDGPRARPRGHRPQQRGDRARRCSTAASGPPSRSIRRPRWATSAWWRSRATTARDHIFIDSSADWGVSDPLAVPKTARLMLERGIRAEDVEAICYGNALAAYGQSGQMKEDDWLSPSRVDQRTLFEGNSVLRGQAAARGRAAGHPRSATSAG